MGTEKVARNLRVRHIHRNKTRQTSGAPRLCPADSVFCAWCSVARRELSAQESPAARQLQGPRPSVFYKATSLWPARLGWPDFLLLDSENNVFTAQHMRKQNSHLFRSHCRFSCPTLTCSGIWRKFAHLCEPVSPATANQAGLTIPRALCSLGMNYQIGGERAAVLVDSETGISAKLVHRLR